MRNNNKSSIPRIGKENRNLSPCEICVQITWALLCLSKAIFTFTKIHPFKVAHLLANTRVTIHVHLRIRQAGR
jgi:hypothetical protein